MQGNWLARKVRPTYNPIMDPIRKAVIPVAGKGTRLHPVTRAIPKALFPLVRGRQKVRSVLEWILEEACSAGIDRFAIIVSPEQLEMLRNYLADQPASQVPWDTGALEWIVQSSPAGFGDAVLQAGAFVGDESFLLLLGDHVHLSAEARCPARQVLDDLERLEADAVIGMQPVGPEELPRVGVAGGDPLGSPRGGEDLYRCRDFVEKPDLAAARRRLTTPGLDGETFLAHCGIYGFSAEIFHALREEKPLAEKAGKELQLAAAQLRLLRKCKDRYFLRRIRGRSLDMGTPEGFSRAQAILDRQSRRT